MIRREKDTRPHIIGAAISETMDLMGILNDPHLGKLFQITVVDDGKLLFCCYFWILEFIEASTVCYWKSCSYSDWKMNEFKAYLSFLQLD